MEIKKFLKEETKRIRFESTHREQLSIIDGDLREVLLRRLVKDYMKDRVSLTNFNEMSHVIGPRINLVAIATSLAK